MATLQFKGKAFVQNFHLAVKFHELVPQKKKSLTEEVSLHDNVIVHGDNLKALKALLPTYSGKVKCVYIDPPYNTGNENWVYNDNVNSPMMQEWLGKVVDGEDLTRHDKWLCMMMPRLRLLRELLRDDGVIFVSIDDNEVHHLRMMMDEIFGAENFVATIIWEKVYSPKSSAKYFSENHDYIIVYAKSKPEWSIGMLPRTEEADDRYDNPDNDPRGPWKPSDFSARNPYSKGKYSIECPGGRIVPAPPSGRYWRSSEETFWDLDKDNRIWWGSDKNQIPSIKRFLTEVKQGLVPETIWTYQEVGHTQDAKKSILEIFGDDYNVFNTPKPVELLKRMIRLSSNEGDIILDAFAGSGTTAHAVLELNKEDAGNRKFVLVECEDYADTLTAERVRRVITGVKTAKDPNLKAGLGGSFSYFELGDPIDLERFFDPKRLPAYAELARYVFFTATGHEFNPKKFDEARMLIGETAEHEVYLMYKPDITWLKQAALTLDAAKALGKPQGKRRLVFAPTKYLDPDRMEDLQIDFAQLPFEIYRIVE